MIALIGRIEVIVQSTAMDSVVELLGDVGFVGRHMQHVSTRRYCSARDIAARAGRSVNRR